jgi:hypothetical protein
VFESEEELRRIISKEEDFLAIQQHSDGVGTVKQRRISLDILHEE